MPRKTTPRKTWVSLDGERIDLQNEFAGFCERRVAYAVFRRRCLSAEKRGLLDRHALAFAAGASRADWISFYGGGRAKGFVYDGDDFPAQRGKLFRSVSSFLITVGHADKVATVWDRLKRGWTIDSAISEPVVQLSDRRGSIYRVICRPTGQEYVGLTLLSVATRWKQHVARSRCPKANGLLHRAIREFGERSFELVELESGLSVQELGARERFWIEALDTTGPNGLNAARGGQLGGGRGIRTDCGGRMFRSRVEAASTLARETGLAPWVISTRLAAGRPLPASARRRSKHPEAGSRHWRRWKSLLKRAASKGEEICAEWLDYDRFKTDTLPGFREGLKLTRSNVTAPWSASNFAWKPEAEIVERTHGKAVEAFGRRYQSLGAAAKAHGLGPSTLRDRLVRQRLSAEQALIP